MAVSNVILNGAAKAIKASTRPTEQGAKDSESLAMKAGDALNKLDTVLSVAKFIPGAAPIVATASAAVTGASALMNKYNENQIVPEVGSKTTNDVISSNAEALGESGDMGESMAALMDKSTVMNLSMDSIASILKAGKDAALKSNSFDPKDVFKAVKTSVIAEVLAQKEERAPIDPNNLTSEQLQEMAKQKAMAEAAEDQYDDKFAPKTEPEPS